MDVVFGDQGSEFQVFGQFAGFKLRIPTKADTDSEGKRTLGVQG
jgi:hypothetical protein